jgi:hypothetical protein
MNLKEIVNAVVKRSMKSTPTTGSSNPKGGLLTSSTHATSAGGVTRRPTTPRLGSGSSEQWATGRPGTPTLGNQNSTFRTSTEKVESRIIKAEAQARRIQGGGQAAQYGAIFGSQMATQFKGEPITKPKQISDYKKLEIPVAPIFATDETIINKLKDLIKAVQE